MFNHNVRVARWVPWGACLLWTGALLVYMTQSPDSPAIAPIAPPSRPGWQREVVFIIGHLLGFGATFLLWRWPLCRVTPRWCAWMAATCALTTGLVAEAAQSTLPDRSASVLDLFVNLLGVVAAWGLVRWHSRVRG